MSEPEPSVTPQNVRSPTPHLPSCSTPCRWPLRIGHYVTVFMDHAQPQTVCERHTHPTVQILFCGPGAECIIHWEASNAHHQLELIGEHVWIIGAGVPHWIEWHREAFALVFYVKPEYGAEIVESDITGASLFSLRQVAKCDAKILHLLHDFECINQPNTETERLHLDSLASLVTLRLFRAWNCLREGGIAHEATLSDAILHRLNRLIDERLETKILLSDMAREVGMSRSNLCRLFKRRMGVSLGQYLISRRIERAKALLRVQDHRIGEISLAVGFSSQGHFDVFFKKWTGVTPTEFRKFLTCNE